MFLPDMLLPLLLLVSGVHAVEFAFFPDAACRSYYHFPVQEAPGFQQIDSTNDCTRIGKFDRGVTASIPNFTYPLGVQITVPTHDQAKRDTIELYQTFDCAGPAHVVKDPHDGNICHADVEGQTFGSVRVVRDLSWHVSWRMSQKKGFNNEDWNKGRNVHGSLSIWQDTLVARWKLKGGDILVIPVELWDPRVHTENKDIGFRRGKKGEGPPGPGPFDHWEPTREFCQRGWYGRIFRELCEERDLVPKCTDAWSVNEEGEGMCNEGPNGYMHHDL